MNCRPDVRILPEILQDVRLLVADGELDSMYGKERAELSVSHDGVCYLVYRRYDGGDYAIVWSPATLIPASTMAKMPDVLVVAMLGAGA